MPVWPTKGDSFVAREYNGERWEDGRSASSSFVDGWVRDREHLLLSTTTTPSTNSHVSQYSLTVDNAQAAPCQLGSLALSPVDKLVVLVLLFCEEAKS